MQNDDGTTGGENGLIFRSPFTIHNSSFPLSDRINPHIFADRARYCADINFTMDVTTISGASAFQQQKIASNVSSSVAAKVLESERTQGAGVLQLLAAASPQASNPNGKIDVKA